MALLYLLIVLLHSSFSAADPVFKLCEGGKYTDNSTYQSNLNQLLSVLASLNTSFGTHAKGSDPDTAYGLILCRGDVTPTDCRSCIQNAAQDGLSICPLYKQATLWYDSCELRYSDVRFLSSVDNSNSQILVSANNVTEHPENFIWKQRELLDKLTYHAAYNSSLMFSTGTVINGSDTEMVGLAQCTRDLSMEACSWCLQQIRGMYTPYEARQGGRACSKSCNFRYDVYQFYQGRPTIMLDLTTLPPSPSLPPPSPPPVTLPIPSVPTPVVGGRADDSKKLLSIMIPIVVVTMLLIAICVFLWCKRATRSTSSTSNLKDISSVEPVSFDLSTLKLATENFSEANKLGQCGFGSVYKGTLADGKEVAVKRLSTSSTQGLDELKNELFFVAKLQHRNLVKLLGVCLEDKETMLVYDYLPNTGLDSLLFDPIKCKLLNWETRFNIIGGIAQGLVYLHEESNLKVIHRDLKASNILLDADMNPKISDFGLARLLGGDETHGLTSQVVGTFGYMAPEYALHGHFSTKVDVFSYGVIALEIVTGRKSHIINDSESDQDFLTYIWNQWINGTILAIVDPSLEDASKDEVLRCIHIALLCVQRVPAERPPMSSVVIMLHGPPVPLQAPLQPRVSHQIVNHDMLPVSVNDVSITEMQPR